MRFKLFAVAMLVLLVTGAAIAQEYPKAEAALMYQYVRTSTTGFAEQFNMNGGTGSITFNFAKHIGLEAEFGGAYQNNVRQEVTNPLGGTVTANIFQYLFGPKFAYRAEKATLYGHTLFGGARLGGTLSTSDLNVGGSNNSFAMAIGGGFDFNAGKRFAIRPAQLDYFMTRFNVGGASNTQNNFRYSAGVVFKF